LWKLLEDLVSFNFVEAFEGSGELLGILWKLLEDLVSFEEFCGSF
jgi:hypothetical protein